MTRITSTKVEVFNANLRSCSIATGSIDLAEMKRRLAAHLRWYNHGRTHHAPGGLLVPADRFRISSRVSA